MEKLLLLFFFFFFVLTHYKIQHLTTRMHVFMKLTKSIATTHLNFHIVMPDQHTLNEFYVRKGFQILFFICFELVEL